MAETKPCSISINDSICEFSVCIVVVCGELKSHSGEAVATESGGILNICSLKSH